MVQGYNLLHHNTALRCHLLFTLYQKVLAPSKALNPISMYDTHVVSH